MTRASPSAVHCVCGLAAEAKIARAAGFAAIVGAGDRARTTVLVEGVVRQANCLVSFGIAGALAPHLRAANVVISTEVFADGRHWQAAEPLRSRAVRLAAGIGAAQGPVLGAPNIIATPSDKRRAWEATGAIAVDLESGVVAAVAAAAGIPFIVVRAIADTADRALPPAALVPLTTAGRPNLAGVLRSIVSQPWQLAALVRLARESRAALAALAAPARALRDLVGPP